MARILASFWRRLWLPGFTFGVWSDLWTLFFFQNVNNFRPNHRERQFYCATGRFFGRKPVIKRAIEAARWRKCRKKFEELSKKVDSLCKLVAESNSGRKQNQRKVTQRSMCLQAMRNQWNILYIYVKIFIYMIFVFFSRYPVYINLYLRYCENYKIKLESYENKINLNI